MKLYYFNARWYDPALGRFVSVDPAQDSINWFVYAGNNPLVNIDPTGMVYVPADLNATDAWDEQISNYEFYHSRVGSHTGTTGGHRPEPTLRPRKKSNWNEIDLNNQGAMMHWNMPERFMYYLENVAVSEEPNYIYGGGSIPKITLYDIEYSNLDPEGNWIGYDCSGGIVASIRYADSLSLKEFGGKNPAMMHSKAKKENSWLYFIDQEDMKPGDLILVNFPSRIKEKKRWVEKKDKKGNVVMGAYDHSMTYTGSQDNGNDIITTEGSGGDIRLNSNSTTKTQRFNLDKFKKIATGQHSKVEYSYARINWAYFVSKKYQE